MNILVLNSGSSSIKCSFYEKFSGAFAPPAAEIKIEWKNVRKPNLKALRAWVAEKKIDCIGHRIVHGGSKYRESVKIDRAVKKTIRSLADLAPLHNRADLAGIETLEKLFPDVLQVAVFDTAFHHTLPQAASVYPGPYAWVRKGIHRFGFHGINFQYCARAAVQLLAHPIEKMVVCHLGSGASLCAIQNGKSVDTTMGFTPLEGLMMDTRSGSVDPGILLYLLDKKKKRPKELIHELYEKSGLLGLSGLSSDMRDLLKAKDEPRVALALAVYLHRLTSYIGSMAASLGGIDVLVFTAGIGENASFIRKQACKQLSFLGIELLEPDTTGDRVLSAPHSRVKVLLIHAQENYEIARECWRQRSQR